MRAAPSAPVRSRRVARRISRPLAQVAQDRVHQGPFLVPEGGVDHHAIRFVDGEDVLILIEDIEGDRLRRKGKGLLLGDHALEYSTQS